MRWTKLIVRNFLAINEAELELDNQGLILIEGKNLSDPNFESNGSGKTSLIPDAISYVLYDTTTRGDKADDVINNKVGKNTEVILEGVKGADTYRIERYRKHSKFKNKVKLFRNDIEITAKSAADTNKEIVDIIGVPHTTFINSILFAQDDGVGSFAVQTDARKKEILDDLLSLNIYSSAQAIAKERVKQKDMEILQKQRDIEKMEWELGQVDTLEQQDKINYQNTRNLIQQEQKNLAETIKQQHDFPAKYFPVVDKAREEVEQLRKQRDEMKNIDIAPYQVEVNKAQQQVMATKNEIARLTQKQEEIVKNYKKVQTSTNCPICGSELDPTHRTNEMTALREELRQVMTAQQSLSPLLTQQEEAYQEGYNTYLEKKAIYDNALTAYRNVAAEVQKREQTINNYENTLANYKVKVANIMSTLEKLQNIPEPKTRDSDRETIKQKITAQKHELVALEKEKTKLENVVKVYSNEGVKSHKLDLYTPFLNKQGNKYLKKLAGSNMELKFSTRTPKKDGTFSEKFDVQLMNSVGGDRYKSNSKGERKRADLSIALALQDLVLNSTNLIVYDEAFDGLDEVGVENSIALLQERVREVGTVFVITHNVHFKALFEKVITIVKDKNGISTIEKGKKRNEAS